MKEMEKVEIKGVEIDTKSIVEMMQKIRTSNSRTLRNHADQLRMLDISLLNNVEFLCGAVEHLAQELASVRAMSSKYGDPS